MYPGIKAVLVRLPQAGPVLLAIDAMSGDIGDYTPETRPIGPFDMDRRGCAPAPASSSISPGARASS